MRVGVVIPCHNDAHYLVRCLSSVRQQDYEVELVVVDDGSTIPVELPRDCGVSATLVRQPPQGLAAARNTGLRHLSTPLVAFLDVDDTWAPGFLQRCCRRLESDSRYVAVYGAVVHVDDLTGRQRFVRPVDEEWDERRLLMGNFLAVHAVVCRRAAVIKAGEFDQQLVSAEDWDLWLRLRRLGSFGHVKKAYAHYHFHGQSMASAVDTMVSSQLRVVELACERQPTLLPLRAQASKRVFFRGAKMAIRRSKHISKAAGLLVQGMVGLHERPALRL